MATCPLCEKDFMDRRGLHGHYRFVHGIEYGSGEPAKNTFLMEAIRERLEKRRKGLVLIDKIIKGEFELIPRSAKKESEAEVQEIEKDKTQETGKDKKRKKSLEKFGG